MLARLLLIGGRPRQEQEADRVPLSSPFPVSLPRGKHPASVAETRIVQLNPPQWRHLTTALTRNRRRSRCASVIDCIVLGRAANDATEALCCVTVL
jgi:hypothetical protein